MNLANTFSHERLLVTDEQLKEWTVERVNGVPIQVSGPCPNCGHHTTADITVDVLATAQAGQEVVALPPPRERITRVVDCQCGQPHLRAVAPPPAPVPPAPADPAKPADAAPPEPPSELSCGRWWLVSVLLTPSVGQQEVRAGDESLLQAAKAVQTALETEETRIRSSAEKWIAGIASLLSLFGLSGVIVGKDAFDSIPTPGAIVAALLAALALLAAAAAIRLSYLAAYGWPVPIDIGDDEKLRQWFSERRERLKTAAADLRNGVSVACWALAALAGALAVIWFWPREDPSPLVQVTLKDQSFVCGKLLASKDASIRVQRSNGDVKTLQAGDIQRLDIKPECKS